jgi:hypothetical protein
VTNDQRANYRFAEIRLGGREQYLGSKKLNGRKTLENRLRAKRIPTNPLHALLASIVFGKRSY